MTDRLKEGEEPRRGLSELLERLGVVARRLSCIAESARHEDLDMRRDVVKGLGRRRAEGSKG